MMVGGARLFHTNAARHGSLGKLKIYERVQVKVQALHHEEGCCQSE